MQAVIEVIGSVMAALFVGILAQLGVDTAAHEDRTQQPEKVVARSQPAKPRQPVHRTEDCPEAAAPKADLV